jgi:hypothetical protein
MPVVRRFPERELKARLATLDGLFGKFFRKETCQKLLVWFHVHDKRERTRARPELQ